MSALGEELTLRLWPIGCSEAPLPSYVGKGCKPFLFGPAFQFEGAENGDSVETAVQDRSRTLSLRALLLPFAVLSMAGQAGAQSQPNPPATYATDGPRVLPDGRTLHLHCRGAGLPTVLLDAGLGLDSSVWGKVHPELARTTRTCAYDRAGYGSSDPGPLPRDARNLSNDLLSLLQTSGEGTPFVIVAHSAAATTARIVAGRRPEMIAGLVLVDPGADVAALRKVGPVWGAAHDAGQGAALKCIRATAAGEMKPGASIYTECGSPPLDGQLASRSMAKSILSESESEPPAAAFSPSAPGSLGDLPVIVLTAEDKFAARDGAAPTETQPLRKLWAAGGAALAALSTRGAQRTVPGASHVIQFEKPEAVIAAVNHVVAQVRAKSSPPGRAALASGAERTDEELTKRLEALAAKTPGSLGACIVSGQGSACVNGDRRYSMQSVMKLLVAVAAFDAADRGALQIDEQVVIRRRDLSLYVQPIARLVGPEGYRTTWRDLIQRAVIDSDSAATDVLLARLGGPPEVQRMLLRKGLRGIRIDRNERDLQTEIAGLRWRPEFVDPAVLEHAEKAVPEAERRAARRAYIADDRDTSTPRSMAELLHKLGQGRLLKERSTADLLSIMRETKTFPTRLRAGAPDGWGVGHKTGSSGSFEGRVTATNDVGLYFPPGGEPIAVAVFLAESPASSAERDRVIARVGELAS